MKPLTPVNMLRPGTSGHDLVVKERVRRSGQDPMLNCVALTPCAAGG